MRETVVLPETKARHIDAVECPSCSGYAEEVEVTKAEVREHQTCGRSYACCINAFICKRCGQRIIAHLEAPEWQ